MMARCAPSCPVSSPWSPSRWPDVVIVIAILGLGAGGIWALWGDRLGDRGKPATPQSTESVAPSN